jgi:hypothetical protein
LNVVTAFLGRRLALFLSEPRHVHGVSTATPPERLLACLEPGDVLLVEGNSRISTAIKYLTQSTWSHAALYVGTLADGHLGSAEHCFIEADVVDGVRSIGIGEFAGFHTRICRPFGLRQHERQAVVDFAVSRLGHTYDLKNVFDLARYLLPTPPVPTSWRRRMIALGSGDPTRAICSTLIAQAFQTIDFPILPLIEQRPRPSRDCPACAEEVLKIRHHSLYAPRDFDVSPYFRVIKPTIEDAFDFRTLNWDTQAARGA